MDLGIADRVAVVTGSSRGIGRAIAELLGREGARVAVTYCRGREQAAATADAISAAGGEACTVPLDLESVPSIRQAVETVAGRWGRVDILVNNAVDWGPRPPDKYAPFDQLPAPEWRQMLRTNIEGPYAATQAVVPWMRKQQWGRIVSVSSTAAIDGLDGAAWYAAAKAALHGLTHTLTHELGPCGILANVVMPGLTLTEAAGHVPTARRDECVRATPIGRLLEPREVAPAVVFLCSALNTAVTGQVIRVSGGG